MTTGYVMQALFWNVNYTAASFIPSLILVGAGIGTMMGQTGNLTLSAVSVQQAGEASGVNNTFRQMGATLGTAIIGAVIIASITSSMISGVKKSTVIPAPFKVAVSSAVRQQASNIEFGGGAQLPASIPKKMGDEILSIGHQSVTTANRIAILFAACFSALAFVVSFLLPGRKQEVRAGESLASESQQEEVVTPGPALEPGMAESD